MEILISKFEDILYFIEESIHKIKYFNVNDEDILILFPPEYIYPFQKFLSERNILVEIFHLKDNFKYRGINCKFISPENKVYVYLKEYTLKSNTKEFNFQLDLN